MGNAILASAVAGGSSGPSLIKGWTRSFVQTGSSQTTTASGIAAEDSTFYGVPALWTITSCTTAIDPSSIAFKWSTITNNGAVVAQSIAVPSIQALIGQRMPICTAVQMVFVASTTTNIVGEIYYWSID